ncbi:unnamed protein product [Trifolium pratense]|uniref:Uncharacterized protein n=1 Tax=Trifolium pratense TaxID=57577 RepID=A0ACB0J6W8_TRIPR|nr:unnamed protein product [Trifolium pratense]
MNQPQISLIPCASVEERNLLADAAKIVEKNSKPEMCGGSIKWGTRLKLRVATSEDKGKSIFLSDKTFKVFVVSDALAFFFSMTSLLMFLSAINGRYAEGDFILTLYLDCF